MPRRLCSQPARSWADGSTGLPYTLIDRGSELAVSNAVGQRGPPRGDDRPGQIGVPGGVVTGPPLERLERVGVADHVGDAAVGEHPQRVVGDDLGRLGVPPGHHRGIGGQQRQRHRLGVQGQASVHAQHDRLARAVAPADRDLGVQAGPGHGVVVADDGQGAHGVTRRGHGHRGLDLRGVLLLHDDDQGQGQPAGHPTAGATFLGQGPHDLRTGCVPQGCHERLLGRSGQDGAIRAHGRRQTRPSRASISSASLGPHSPARYLWGRCWPSSPRAGR